MIGSLSSHNTAVWTVSHKIDLAMQKSHIKQVPFIECFYAVAILIGKTNSTSISIPTPPHFVM
jgi:hypothetical protein